MTPTVGSLRIERQWAMPSAWTFSIPPIGDLVAEEVNEHPGMWVDPFCGKCSPATIKNDLNPDIEADYHLDAVDFLRQFAEESVDGVILDPPYSPRQIAECYKSIGIPVDAEVTSMRARTLWKDEMARILRLGGVAISCGWNTVGLGKIRGFEQERLLIVCHGEGHNDTIVTVERKTQGRLVS